MKQNPTPENDYDELGEQASTIGAGEQPELPSGSTPPETPAKATAKETNRSDVAAHAGRGKGGLRENVLRRAYRPRGDRSVGHRVKRRALPALTVALAMVAGAFAYLYADINNAKTSAENELAARGHAAEVASEYAQKSLTYDHQSIDKFFQSVQENASPALVKRYDEVKPTLTQIMQQAQVSASGRVLGTSVTRVRQPENPKRPESSGQRSPNASESSGDEVGRYMGCRGLWTCRMKRLPVLVSSSARVWLPQCSSDRIL